jgi:organic radical activating enzyme
MQYRKEDRASISFTGGEPTVNPNFIPFVKYLKEAYEEKYKGRWQNALTLTTNGAMSQKMAQAVIDNLSHVTVSYHAESNQKLKDQVRDRILQFKKAEDSGNFRINVNVMFHAQHFDECKDLCEFLEEHDVKYVPRVIGEEADSKPSFAHKYSPEQLDYMKNYWNNNTKKLNKEKEVSKVLSAAGEKKSESDKLGMSIGRPCCGMRNMCLSNKTESITSQFVNKRDFKGWSCSVNWFFLHIEQQTDQVFHHQTCQAKFDGTRGAIGKLSQGDIILKDLKNKLENKKMTTIICPKQTCGCGLCAPKSMYSDRYKEVVTEHIDVGVLNDI